MLIRNSLKGAVECKTLRLSIRETTGASSVPLAGYWINSVVKELLQLRKLGWGNLYRVLQNSPVNPFEAWGLRC